MSRTTQVIFVVMLGGLLVAGCSSNESYADCRERVLADQFPDRDQRDPALTFAQIDAVDEECGPAPS